MSVIQKKVDVAAGEANENMVSGSTFEFASTNQIVSLGINGSAAGLFVTILAGSTTVLEESEAVNLATFPTIPDEMYYNFAMAQGDRLVIRGRNPSAGVVSFRLIAQITPV